MTAVSHTAAYINRTPEETPCIERPRGSVEIIRLPVSELSDKTQSVYQMGAQKDISYCWTNSHGRKAASGSTVEFLQKGFGLLQIRRVKPLRKPLVHRSQQGGGVLVPVLGLPQAGQAGGGAEFPGLGLLATGNVEGVVETGFCLGLVRIGLPQ